MYTSNRGSKGRPPLGRGCRERGSSLPLAAQATGSDPANP